jgi:drug/metabolite transporter (DMT)-like permease
VQKNKKQNSLKLKINPRVILYAGGLCVSLSPIFVRLAGVSGLSTTFYRAFFAFIVLLPYVLWCRLYRLNGLQIMGALAGGLLFSFDMAFWNVAVTKSEVLTATVLGSLAPVWTGLLVFVLFKEKQPINYWLGVVLAFVGIFVLTGITRKNNSQFNTANLLAIAGGIFYALYLVTTQKLRTTTHTISFMFYTLTGYVISSFIICLITKTPLVGFSQGTWASFAALGIISQLAGWTFISYTLGHLRSTEVSFTLLGQSVIWPTLIAMFIFEEIPTTHQITGTVVILLGVALNHLSRNKTK